MNKIRAQLRAHKVIIAVMGFLLVGGFAVERVLSYQGYAPTTVIENGTITINNPVNPAPDVNLGAIPGSELNFPSWTVNGVEQFQERKSMQIATSTTCYFGKPLATSTLDFFSANIASTTGEAVSWVLATSTTQYATSTVYGLNPIFTVAADNKGHFVWTPNVLGSNDPKNGVTPASSTIQQINAFVITPSDYIILRSGYSAAAGHDLGGTCQIRYTEL